MLSHTHLKSSVAALACLLLAGPAMASPAKVVHINTPQCDDLFIPFEVDEIGDFLEFPPDEALAHFDRGLTADPSCPAHDQTFIPNVLVEIRNLTGKAWTDVWYVADQETTITNFDGEANASGFAPVQEAFRIDAIGVNRPLVFESVTVNGIWDIGETWVFILQDYTNSLGLPPDAITSIGVGNGSLPPATGIVDSSGSIIAVPEPGSLALLSLGAAAAFRRSGGRG